MQAIEKEHLSRFLFCTAYFSALCFGWYCDVKGAIMPLESRLLQNESGQVFNPFCFPDLTGSTIVPTTGYCKPLTF